ncbi:MAG: peptide-methionine (R)-S-oxide reductase MsrB [Balneolales bacterium]
MTPKQTGDVNININKPLSKKIQERILPSWFNMDLFPGPEDKLELSESDWQKRLSHSEYRVMRSEGTDRPFANEYFDTKIKGVYLCRGCSMPVFSSSTKFDSGTGWPSFFAPVSQEYIGVSSDKSMLMERTEVHCARCKAHLGHVFDDGPQPTGLRYCLNSNALRLIDETAHQKIVNGMEDELDFTLNR